MSRETTIHAARCEPLPDPRSRSSQLQPRVTQQASAKHSVNQPLRQGPDICTAVLAENVVQRYATVAEISTRSKS